jgi:DNA-binding FadR family transcriptional regulator
MLRQLCEFSMSIEPAAAALAVLGSTAKVHAELTAACDRLSAIACHPSAKSGAAIALHEAIVAVSGNAFYRPLSGAVGAAHRVLARHGTSVPLAGAISRYRAVVHAIETRAPERTRHEMTALLELVFEPIAGRPAAA